MAREKKEAIRILIASPKEGQVFPLGTDPIETKDIPLQATVFQGDLDITTKAKVLWQLKLSWQATYQVYQTKSEVSGSPAKVKFQTGGILRIRAAVVIDGREYSTRIKVNIIGTNPSKAQLGKALDSDLLKAQAYLESTWAQFDKNGQPLVNPDSSMRGLLQISEKWWGRKSPLPLKDFNRIAWQWAYNIKTAKLILGYYNQQIKTKFPSDKNEKQSDRTLKAYKSGPASFRSNSDPSKYKYVQIIRNYMRAKPWEKL